jgi:two-component system NtrC family response regulator
MRLNSSTLFSQAVGGRILSLGAVSVPLHSPGLGITRGPGNVRELENRVKRAVVMTDGPLLSSADLGLTATGEDTPSLTIRDARSRAEREVLQLALAQAGSNLSKAAKLLGISRPTLYDLMQQHQIGFDL